MCRKTVQGAYRAGALAYHVRRAGKDETMREITMHTHARQLWQALGPKAIAEAAQKATKFEQKHDQSQAGYWRRVEAILVQMRGPHQP
jgi:hypothetical protein